MVESVQTVSKGTWESGQAYEPYMGRWSRQIAALFLDWLAPPRRARWLDVGTGTGAIVQAIVARAEPDSVVALDRSDGYLAYARAHQRDPRVAFRQGDAARIPAEANAFDVATSGLMLNFVPDAGAVLAEMARVTRPGGTVAAYVWDYGGRMEILRWFWDVAVQLDPAVAPRDEANRSALWRPDVLAAHVRDAGLRDVAVQPLEVPARFPDFESYWAPFRGGQGTVASYAMGLDEPARQRLCAELDARLPRAGDGSIALAVRAWAVRGSVP